MRNVKNCPLRNFNDKFFDKIGNPFYFFKFVFVKYNILRVREFIRDAERYFLQKELARFVNIASLSDEIFL